MQDNNTKKAAAIVSNGCHMKGNLELAGPLYVNGFIRGHIVSSDSVFIGSSGSITGDIKAKFVMVNGLFSGTIYTDKIDVLDKGNINGRILAKSCSIVNGGSINGSVKLGFDYREHNKIIRKRK